MGFEPNSAPYGGDGGNLDNTIACTNAVNTASYNFDLSSGGYINGNPAVGSGGTDPMDINAGSGPLAIINPSQNGGARKKRGRKSKRSKKLRRSNKSRLSNKSKKSRSKSRSASRSKVKKVVRKSLRKSKKNKRSKSLK